jgi:hypothetical protein
MGTVAFYLVAALAMVMACVRAVYGMCAAS